MSLKLENIKVGDIIKMTFTHVFCCVLSKLNDNRFIVLNLQNKSISNIQIFQHFDTNLCV
jgi:hypothetical protein